MRVLLLVPYPPESAGGQRFRTEQWLGILGQSGVHTTIAPLMDNRAYSRLLRPGHGVKKALDTGRSLARRISQLRRLADADVVVIYREAFKLGPPLIETLVARRVPFLFDFDDAIWLGDTSNANRWVAPLKSAHKVGAVIRRATVTTTGNQYLADYSRQFSPNVQVIPTTIDTSVYRPQRHQGTGVVRIGWSGSPTTSPYLATIQGALRRVAAELPVEVTIIGDPDFEMDDVPNLQVAPWRLATERQDVGSFDIGIMPMPDNAWTRGKCGFKALLYMALGVATVASPVGVNPEIISHGVNGLLANDETQWVEALTHLAMDGALRGQLGTAGRDTVESRYSALAWAPVFHQALISVANGAN